MSTLPMDPSRAVQAHPPGTRFAAVAYQWLWRLAGLLGRRQITPVRDAAAEANAVRELALEVRRHDPRFADDLFAAADRHERLYG